MKRMSLAKTTAMCAPKKIREGTVTQRKKRIHVLLQRGVINRYNHSGKLFGKYLWPFPAPGKTPKRCIYQDMYKNAHTAALFITAPKMKTIQKSINRMNQSNKRMLYSNESVPITATCSSIEELKQRRAEREHAVIPLWNLWAGKTHLCY